MKQLTRLNTKTWTREECSLKEWLIDSQFYDYSDRGQIESLESTVAALEKIVLILADFLEEKYGQEIVQKFVK